MTKSGGNNDREHESHESYELKYIRWISEVRVLFLLDVIDDEVCYVEYLLTLKFCYAY